MVWLAKSERLNANRNIVFLLLFRSCIVCMKYDALLVGILLNKRIDAIYWLPWYKTTCNLVIKYIILFLAPFSAVCIFQNGRDVVEIPLENRTSEDIRTKVPVSFWKFSFLKHYHLRYNTRDDTVSFHGLCLRRICIFWNLVEKFLVQGIHDIFFTLLLYRACYLVSKRQQADRWQEVNNVSCPRLSI